MLAVRFQLTVELSKSHEFATRFMKEAGEFWLG